jgi:uncharacterized membrane protein YeiB
MGKRTLAWVIGVLALAAFIVGSALMIGLFRDSRGALKDFVEPWWVALVILGVCSAILGALIIGVRFLHFALTGRSYGARGRWLRPVLLGCGLFWPVFVASLAVGLNWAYRMSHGNQDENALVALKVSLFLSVASAVIGIGVLLRKARSHQ